MSTCLLSEPIIDGKEVKDVFLGGVGLDEGEQNAEEVKKSNYWRWFLQ